MPYLLDEPNIRFHPLSYYKNLTHYFRSGPGLKASIRKELERGVREWDLVWLHGPNPVALMLAEACIRSGVKFFLALRQNQIEQMRFMYSGLRRIAAMWVARLLEHRFRRLARGRMVFAVGEEISAQSRAITPQTHTFFASLMTNSKLRDRMARPSRPEPGRILYVGRLSAEKGVDMLLEALAELKLRGMPCHLDIIGSGPLDHPLRELAQALGVESQVTFHGQIAFGSPLFEFYQKAMLLAIPSHSEGLPQVIFEALAFGLPVVATTVGGIPAFLRDGQNGLLVPPGNPRALAEAMATMLVSPDLRDRLRHSGQTLITKHTLEAERDRMVNIIRNNGDGTT